MNWFKSFLTRFRTSPERDPEIRINERGFDVMSEVGGEPRASVNWDSVHQIETYKVDLVVIDCVYLSFRCGEEVVEVSEDWAGFVALSDAMLKQFPIIRDDWKNEVVLPPFEESRSILFSKADKKLT